MARMKFQDAISIEKNASQIASYATHIEIAEAWERASEAWAELGQSEWAKECRDLADAIREYKIDFVTEHMDKKVLKPINSVSLRRAR